MLSNYLFLAMCNVIHTPKMKQIIIIKTSQIALIYNQGKTINLIMEHDLYQLGAIYAGKIDSVLQGLDAAFVNLYKTGKNGFLQIEDLKQTKIEKRKNNVKTSNKKKI